MPASRTKFILITALAILTATFAWALTQARPPVSLSVLRYTTNESAGTAPYICAIVALTNHSARPITYLAFPSEQPCHFTVLHDTPHGWQDEHSGFMCGTGIEQFTLVPSHGFTFQAPIDPQKRSKVAFAYSDGRTPSRLAQHLPEWLKQRLPWSSPWHTVTTAPIDLRPH